MTDYTFLYDVREDTPVEIAEKIIFTMKVHHNNAIVQIKALQTLWLIGKNKANREQLDDYDIGEAIMLSMKRHPKDFLVLEAGCAAMTFLNEINDLMRMGGGKQAVEALRKFPDNPKLIEHACGAIRTMARSSYNSKRLIELGVVDLVKTCMIKNEKNSRVQHSCIGVVWSLASLEENKQSFWNAGIPPLVMKAMEDHELDFIVQEYACAVVWSLGRYYSMCNLGFYGLVLNAIDKHIDNAQVVKFACEAIRTLASLESLCLELVSDEAPKLIRNAMNAHENNKGVQDIAQQCLDSLAATEDRVQNTLKDDQAY